MTITSYHANSRRSNLQSAARRLCAWLRCMAARSGLAVHLLSLAAAAALGLWLLHHGGDDGRTADAPPALRRAPARSAELAVTGVAGRGVPDERHSLALSTPQPYVVYLVATAERRDAITALGLREDEMVLVVGASEEGAETATPLQIARMDLVSVARDLHVVDLRGTYATPVVNGVASAPE